MAAYSPIAQFVPEISSATAIAPVADWHELLFLTGQVLRHDDPAAAERWLDGLLRLQGQVPAESAGQLRPYLVQLFPEIKKGSEDEITALLGGPIEVYGHEGLVQALLLSWATGFATPRVASVEVHNPYAARTPLLPIEKQRYLLAEALLREQRVLPLLSTPTHRPNWVAPTALVGKLLAYQTAGISVEPADFAVALARCARAHPADSAAACCLLPQLHDLGLRELLGWFLSDAEEPLPAPDKPAGKRAVADFSSPLAEALPELWAVAARTKTPAAIFPTLPARLGYDYAGVAQPLRPTFGAVPRENTYPDPQAPGQVGTFRFVELAWGSAATDAAPSPLLLYAPPGGKSESGSWETSTLLAADLPYFVALLPQYQAPLYEYALRCAAWADNLEAPERDVMAQALRSLLGPGPVFEQATTAVVASGLIHHTPLCRGLAQEVLLRAVALGRLVPGLLGQVLGRQLAVGYSPVPRLADALAPLRAIDAVTDDALRQLLDALLPELPPKPPRSLSKLLETYADLILRTRSPVPAAVRVRLGEWGAVPGLKKIVGALLA